MRTLVAGVVVIGLAIAMFLAWPRASDDESPVSESSDSTTTTKPGTTTSTVTTTSEDSHVVETVDEAEEILRELWFGWFEGIYNQDEDRIREVVVLEEMVDTARESFGVKFLGAPQRADIAFEETQILRADEDCLAIWTQMLLSGFRVGEADGVNVLRWKDGRWATLSVWSLRNDLWEADCESSL